LGTPTDKTRAEKGFGGPLGRKAGTNLAGLRRFGRPSTQRSLRYPPEALTRRSWDALPTC